METHHAHHPDNYRDHKKKLSEYLLEFFMLFLAVFLGFIAENIRENIVEKKRAKEYAHLFVGDLRHDLNALDQADKILQRIKVSGDSLGNLLSPENRKIPGGKLYYYQYWSGWRWRFISSDATLQQLKSSGSLRYLGDTSLIRTILNYEEAVKVIYLLQDEIEPQKTSTLNLVQQVFDISVFNKLDSIKEAALDSSFKEVNLNDRNLMNFMNTDYSLLTSDRNKLTEIRNAAYNSSRNYRVLIGTINGTEKKALVAIEALTKEY